MSTFKFHVPEHKRARVIIISDTACEADDPYAITHALLSPKLDVKAVVAEHFMCEKSMERSFQAASMVTQLLKSAVPVLCGQQWPYDGRLSEGARCVIDEAHRDDPLPLFVLCIGAMTTMAAALAQAPDIADKLTVVSIGGHSYEDPFPWREFNWGNDPDAINAILRTNVPLWQIPSSVYCTMRVGIAELQLKVAPCGKIGEYLLKQMDEYNNSDGASWTAGESWSLGDNPSVAAVLNEGCAVWHMKQARFVNPDTTYGAEVPGRVIRVCSAMDSRYVLEDLFSKLAICCR